MNVDIADFYEKNFESYVNKIKSKFPNLADAEDVVQEAFYRAIKYQDCYDVSNKPFEHWFSRILTNCINDKLRDIILKGLSEDNSDEEESKELNFGQRITWGKITNLIDSYGDNKREIIKLHHLKGYKREEISEITQNKPMYVKSVLRSFREELKLC